ncbi:MAG: hypothetical protein GY950_35915 [bacterium]|nr:hypothetical protein [bacterium]
MTRVTYEPAMNKSVFYLVAAFLLMIVSCQNAVPEEKYADYTNHIAQLKKKVPGGFTIVIQEPFVVIGNERPAAVRRRAEKTVKWATDRLKRMYFEKDPAHIIDIWLFKNSRSYKKYTWEIFKIKPNTPFGFSSPRHNALIMNIATGGGTLVHEIVHPFVAANFPRCPAWFNEGLGSLYEGCRGKGKEIIGLVNWRLPSLREAVRRNRVPSFKVFMSTTAHEFYREDPGTNYAQARYLCYYLQEKGLLKTFYHKFRAGCKTDPTGYETLKTVLGETDMTAFKKKWERYILQL